MRIVIDLQSAQTSSRFRGIGRYSVSLARAIVRNAKEHEIWLALNSNFPEGLDAVRETFHGLIPQERIRVFDVPYSLRLHTWEKAASERIREAFLDSIGADVVLLTSLFEGFQDCAITSIGALETGHRTAAIVYDLIPHVFADQYLRYDEMRRFYYDKWNSLKRADALLAISESSRSECIEHMGYPAERVTNIFSAVERDFGVSRLDDEERRALFEALGIERKILLYVPGGFDQRKNFERLIEAYGKLGPELRRQHQLVIASKLIRPIWQDLVRLQKRLGLGENEVVFTDYVDDTALATLYATAELFVFPSLHEGFGLPLLEAMTCGAPVIGSDRSSVPEVIDNPRALFDPYSVRSISTRIGEALGDDDFRQELRAHSATRAAEFSWDKCAIRAIEALERLGPRKDEADGKQTSHDRLFRELAAIPGLRPSESEALRAARSIAFNSGLPGRRQLLLDISTLADSDARSGIQRVVRSLLNELLALDRTDLTIRPIRFANGKFLYANEYTRSVIKHWQESTDEPADIFQDDIYLSLDLNMHLVETYDLHYEMRRLGVKVAFVVYDLLLTQHPEWWPEAMARMFLPWLHHVCRSADQLLCISDAVATEVREWIESKGVERPGGLPDVTSFKLGADIARSLPTSGLPTDAQQVLDRIASKPSFLMVGTVEPRKGYAQAITAFETLWAEGLDTNLVVVGKAGWLMDDLVEKLEHHPERGKRFFWLQGISDEYLEALYAASTCLLAASEGEGFGLPLIEAAQHGVPIIARDIPVFREVAGESAFYFTGLSGPGLADAIGNWLGLFSRSDHPGSSTLKSFTWQESARSLIEALPTNPCTIRAESPLEHGS